MKTIGRKKGKYLCNTQPALLAEIPWLLDIYFKKDYLQTPEAREILIHKVMATKNLNCSVNVFMVEQSQTH